jgi:uncharacterized membrane protein
LLPNAAFRCSDERRLPEARPVRVGASIQVAAPVDRVWEIMSDPERVLTFMSGVTRWEVESEPAAGLGARYRVLFRVGAAEIGGLIEMIEWDPPHELAWTSVLGIDQRGRWRVRDAGRGRTRVEMRMAYGVAGAGLSGWVAERLAGPVIQAHLRRSLQQLRRLVEHEQLRRRAAERRAARVG